MFKYLAIAIALFAATSAQAKEIDLFNGKDLSNWTAFLNKSGENADGHMKAEDSFSVKDGSIYLSGNPHGFLRTKAQFTNFRLKVEWRWAGPNSDDDRYSGLFLRMSGPEGSMTPNYQAEIARTKASTESGDIYVMAYDKKSFVSAPAFNVDDLMVEAGRLNLGLRQRHKTVEKPPGEWNAYDITIDRDHLVVRLNGQLVNEGTGAEIVPGGIGLQSEGSPIQFRNLRVMPIEH